MKYLKILIFLCIIFVSEISYSKTKQDQEAILFKVGDDYAERIMIFSLQGIVNRKKPRLYLLVGDYWGNGARWQKRYENKYGLKFRKIDSTYKLLKYFRKDIKGYIVFDTKIPDSSNIALVMAGLYDAIACPSDKKILKILKKSRYKKLKDFKGLFRNKSSIEIYNWGYKKLWKKCSKKYIGYWPVPTFTRKDNENWWNLVGHAPIDFIVSKKGFCLNLSSKDPKEQKLKDKFLSEMEPFSIAMGWMSEDDVERNCVSHLSSHAVNNLCSTCAYNLSFHSKFKPLKKKYNQNSITPDEIKIADIKDKVYLCFIQSEGDALWADFSAWENTWFSKNRGKVPMGWELQPLLINLAPIMLDYYYETRTPQDYFVCSVAGIGYIHPSMWPKPELDKYLAITDTYMRKLDMKSIFMLEDTAKGPIGPVDFNRIRSSYKKVQSCQGIHFGYFALRNIRMKISGDQIWFPTRYTLNHRNPEEPCVPPKSLKVIKNDIENLASERQPGKPLFISVHVWLCSHGGTIDEVKYLMDHLDPEMFEILRPDKFSAMALKYYRSVPGMLVNGELKLKKIYEAENMDCGDENIKEISVFDKDALNGKARFSSSEKRSKNEDSFLVFGPYTKDLIPGENVKHQVTFRMKISNNRSNKKVVTIDVFQWQGSEEIVTKTIKAKEFKKRNKYQDFVLTFSGKDIKAYGNGLEFRVKHLGTTDLYIDRITLK